MEYLKYLRSFLESVGLTETQIEYVGYCMDGLSYAEISEKLFRSEKALKCRAQSVFARIGVSCRYEMVCWCYKEVIRQMASQGGAKVELPKIDKVRGELPIGNQQLYSIKNLKLG